MKFSFTSQAIDKVPAELVLLMHYQNQIPLHGLIGLMDWRLNGRLSRFIQTQIFTGKAREMLLLPAENRFKAEKMLLLGLGKKEEFEEGHIAQVFDYIFQASSKMKAAQVCLSLSKLLPTQFEWRNAVRLFVSKLFDFPSIGEVIFCEPLEVVQEAKRRQLDFGPNVEMHFD